MPTATLRFKLPEEQSEFRDACDGSRMRSALTEFDQYLKGIAKHDSGPESVAAGKYREHLNALLNEHNLEI